MAVVDGPMEAMRGWIERDAKARATFEEKFLAADGGPLGPTVPPMRPGVMMPGPIGPSPAGTICSLIGDLADAAVQVERLRDEYRHLGKALQEAETRFSGLYREVANAGMQINDASGATAPSAAY